MYEWSRQNHSAEYAYSICELKVDFFTLIQTYTDRESILVDNSDVYRHALKVESTRKRLKYICLTIESGEFYKNLYQAHGMVGPPVAILILRKIEKFVCAYNVVRNNKGGDKTGTRKSQATTTQLYNESQLKRKGGLLR